jgi:hypothetical protein
MLKDTLWTQFNEIEAGRPDIGRTTGRQGCEAHGTEDGSEQSQTNAY